MYRTFFSKANIFWDTIDKVDKSNPNMDVDAYCNFIEIPKGQGGINFIDWLTATSIVKDRDITYFKVEKWTDDETPELKETLYFFVTGINKALRNGYEVNLLLDTWTTYTRHFYNLIIAKDKHPLVNRATLTSGMYNERNADFFRIALTNSDELTDNLADIDVNVNMWYKEYELQKTVYYWDGADGGIVNLEYPNRTSSRTTKNIIPYGLCAVFLEKDTGNFIVFPYHSTSSTMYEITWKNNKIPLWNTVERIDALIGEVHSNLTFLGVFRNAPLAAIQDIQDITWNIYSYDFKGSIGKQSFLFLRLFPESMYQLNLPVEWDILINPTSFAMSATRLHNKIYWTNQVKRIKDFIMNNERIIKSKFKVSFVNEFVLYPVADKYNLTNRVVSFGGALPSATDTYAKQQLASRTRYDSGIAGGILNIAGGVATALTGGLGGAINYGLNKLDTDANWMITGAYTQNNRNRRQSASLGDIPPGNWEDARFGWFDIANNNYGKKLSLGGTLHNLAGVGGIGSGLSKIINESIRYKNQQYLNNATYFNSDTATIYWTNNYIELLREHFGNSLIFTPASIGTSKLYHPVIELENGERFQYQVAKIYHMYGFPLNTYIPLKQLLEDAGNIRKMYIEFNDGWLTENVRNILSGNNINNIKHINTDIMNLLVSDLSGGIRIWYNNSIDYDNFNDRDTTTTEMEQ